MIAVIGCGYWGKNLIRNFFELGVLKSICDDSPQLAQKLAGQYDVEVRSFDEILQDPSIKAVAIAATPSLNTQLSIKALKAGKHVFVEKPHSYKKEDEQKLIKAQLETGKIVFVGHLLMYHTGYLKLKEQLQQGAIGTLQEIRSYRHGLGRLRSEFCVLWELAPHDVSMILDLNPHKVTQINAFGTKSLTDHYDSVRALYVFENGVTAQLSSSWTDPMRQQQLVLQGTQGYLIFDDTKPWAEKVHLVQFDSPMNEQTVNGAHYQIIPLPIEGEEVLKRECQHFIACIEGREDPRTGLKQATPVFNLLYQTEQALATGESNEKYVRI